jgi:CheY-like chemotaxis protein
LAQVHGIVGLHEGHIDVSSRPGEGTTFTIYLPALHLPRPTELPPRATGKGAVRMGQGETILVVEDDATLRTALAESLMELNYEVLEASSGHAALELLAQNVSDGRTIALVLSDLVMPEMGGQALFHAMRERGIAVPVVMLSGHPMEHELERLHTQGLAGWMLKPPDIGELAEVLAEALKGRTP